MLEARMLAAAKVREAVPQRRMAELLEAVLRRPVHQPQVSAWEAGAEPPLDVIDAYARLSGLPREYLAWGDVSPVGETTHPLVSRQATGAELGTVVIVDGSRDEARPKQRRAGGTRRRK